MTTYHLTFITPCFCRGADSTEKGTPEIRPASIRGQLHWWFRALGGKYEMEKAVFGGVHGEAKASKVVVRVSEVPSEFDAFKTLPHKSGGDAAEKNAFAPGVSFKLHISTRLGGFETNEHEQYFQRTLEAWLLMGTLGLRSTRAAGSFIWEATGEADAQVPKSLPEYEKRCLSLLSGSQLRCAILDTPYKAAEEAREVVSDTLGGRDDHEGQRGLDRLRHPLGKVSGGRKTSPLRFRIVTVDQKEFRIAAIWDGRTIVTGNQPSDLNGIIQLLAQKKPRLGLQLANSSLLY